MEDKSKAWREVFEFPVRGRSAKPRNTGLTMLIDKGLGLTETRDLLQLASDYIDFIKLTFGTSAFYSTQLLKEKIALVRSYGIQIFPGGTFLELALIQGKLDKYLARGKELGFDAIEVSDGTITMSDEVRRRTIQQALEQGFQVITEVGKKDPSEKVPQSRILNLIHSDLECGAFKVIVEGRESGKGVVIYDHEGNVDRNELEGLASGVASVRNLLWEAPLKNQQQSLILRFGPDVNLGNIHPEDILALEALRVGLRGDTLKVSLRGYSGMALPGS
ncbi:MAG: phosphosulfolactate synthase [Actinobacteria bacterium]|nr:phosphosulfolactate synthase [Actinomycetota bacterium]